MEWQSNGVIGIPTIIVWIISLISICLPLWINYLENKKNRYTRIITAQTLSNFLFVRENSSLLATLTKPEVIAEAKLRGDTEYKFKVIHAMCNIEVQLKYCFPQECYIIALIRKLCKLSIEYYDSPSDEAEKQLRKIGDIFYKKISVYDYSDWKYIKEQAREKAYTKDSPEFFDIHEEQIRKFNSSFCPKKW